MGFDEKAGEWDSSTRRQELADSLARSIRESVELHPGASLLDVGAGTGLLARRLLPYVGKITGVDSSAGMLREFSKIGKEVRTVHTDILHYEPNTGYDGIVSSMTMHHIEDIDTLFLKLYSLLVPGGFIAVADLEKEDGTFHDGGNDGVFHFGFDKKSLEERAKKYGFADIAAKRVHEIKKEERGYPIFLLVAKKPLRR